MTSLIHVNQYVIRHNKKYDNTLPACRVQDKKSGKSTYCMEVIINGPSRMVYRPADPLSCGAKLWIETESEVTLVGEVNYKHIAKQMKEISK